MMPRYIDAEQIPFIVEGDDHIAYKSVIDDIPTADVEEVRHGEFVGLLVKKRDWKGIKRSYFQPHSCSVCRTALMGTERYCPDCGAKMDGKENKDENQ